MCKNNHFKKRLLCTWKSQSCCDSPARQTHRGLCNHSPDWSRTPSTTKQLRREFWRQSLQQAEGASTGARPCCPSLDQACQRTRISAVCVCVCVCMCVCVCVCVWVWVLFYFNFKFFLCLRVCLFPSRTHLRLASFVTHKSKIVCVKGQLKRIQIVGCGIVAV